MKTHYEQLGLTPQASARAIEQSFLRLSKKFDPSQPANAECSEAREQYLAVRIAYQTLSNADARRLYDATLRKQTLSERVKALRSAAPSDR